MNQADFFQNYIKSKHLSLQSNIKFSFSVNLFNCWSQQWWVTTYLNLPELTGTRSRTRQNWEQGSPDPWVGLIGPEWSGAPQNYQPSSPKPEVGLTRSRSGAHWKQVQGSLRAGLISCHFWSKQNTMKSSIWVVHLTMQKRVVMFSKKFKQDWNC